jgi:hypothetical protein
MTGIAAYRARISAVVLCACGEPAVAMREQRCATCHERERQAAKERRRAKHSEIDKRRRLTRKIAGQCWRCERPSLEDAHFCQEHLEAHRATNRESDRRRRVAQAGRRRVLIEQRLTQGLCTRCGGPRSGNGDRKRVVCFDCRFWGRGYRINTEATK